MDYTKTVVPILWVSVTLLVLKKEATVNTAAKKKSSLEVDHPQLNFLMRSQSWLIL